MFSFLNPVVDISEFILQATSLRGFPCDICGKRLNHPSSVIYHKEAEHNNGRRFVCDTCGKGFKHKQLLQRHQLVHSDARCVCIYGFLLVL